MTEQGLTSHSLDSAIAKNYAFILLGGIMGVFIIVAHFIARKRSTQTQGPEQSHYIFQYRTTLIALLMGMVAVLYFFVTMIWLPSRSPPHETVWSVRMFGNLYWLVLIWVATRSIRGLYLSAAGLAIHNPKTLWIWVR
ncbi:hypothetical protein [Pararhizobium antarcticum]|uniref:Uncharacterized protein n=1 Tax=Pararhizobium antarcticum TaxID=1798805 RepID=A0A657LUZ8_9HYPH|nr:hypothetical protein [Pararhizobium antarcticum]OJF90821.1 hypothetical protein AX761_22830 [Rhizobium sp. 58]OJF99040.1 hypothetical protein AX760_13735 [Pararhizobium antarcticum]